MASHARLAASSADTPAAVAGAATGGGVACVGTADTPAAAAPHEGTSSLDSHAFFASSSLESWSHASCTPVTHFSSSTAISTASLATATTADAALPQVGASSLASHAAFAASSDVTFCTVSSSAPKPASAAPA